MAKAKKKSNKRMYYIGGAIVLLLIVFALMKSKSGNSRDTQVEVGKVEKATITEKVSASGTVQPVVEVKISPEVPGEIIELAIEEGDSVKQGDFLLKLRPDNFISALDRANANYNQQKANVKSAESNLSRANASYIRAQQDFNRQKQLKEEKVISDADFEVAQANFEIAKQDLKAAEQAVEAAKFVLQSSKASVADAQENLRLTNITAPMNGRISKLSVEEGETVVGTSQMQGTEMLRIADLTKMEVRVDVNENDIIKIKRGDKVEIEVDAYASLEKVFIGKVTQIANSANDKISADAVTEFEVRILILNESYQDLIKDGSDYPFKPGMTASVDIITEEKVDILTVPLSAVTTRESKKDDDDKEDDEVDEVVFVALEGKATLQKVKTGISDFDKIEILEGLKEGTEIVTGPFIEVSKKLKDGEKIVFEKEKDKKDDKESEE